MVLENTQFEFPRFSINVPRIFLGPLSVHHVSPTRTCQSHQSSKSRQSVHRNLQSFSQPSLVPSLFCYKTWPLIFGNSVYKLAPNVTLLKWSGRFFVEWSSMNKKNIIIKLFEPYERRKYIFCGLKSTPGVIMTPGLYVFAVIIKFLWIFKKYFSLINRKKISFLIHFEFTFYSFRKVKSYKNFFWEGGSKAISVTQEYFIYRIFFRPFFKRWTTFFNTLIYLIKGRP